ncbi:sugar phosphate isomerase/epimerase [Candidatus Woesearchaeota archaeon]|nr:sugar phosphate isomerase/epimerase [Candidatus Woesearchaeota archaeon]
MPDVFIGASVKQFSRIEEYYANFDHLEIDLNLVKGDFLKTIRQFRDKVYSVHLSHHSMAAAVNSLDYVRRCSGKVAVFHPAYPTSFEELLLDLKIIDRFARKKGLPVMVENVCDRKMKSGRYDGARNPITICKALEELKNRRLGLCLDTGHAVSNELTDWRDPLVYKWLKHIHLSDNVVGKDLHLPFSFLTNPRLKSGIRHLLHHARHEVMIILENKTLEDTIKSYNHIGRMLVPGLKKLAA